MSTDPLPGLDEECFFIAPIGAEEGEIRERSDGVMEYIVAPAAQAVGLTTIRADKIAKPGLITRQVIEHVVGARAAVVDLTGANPNVYYEMAVRHTAQLPTVLIAQNGEKLPFDIAQMRTIFFDHTSLKSAAECRDHIKQHLEEALGGEVDSPIAASVTVQRLEQGTPQDRVLAQLVDGLDDVRSQLRSLSRMPRDLPPQAFRDLAVALEELLAARAHRGDDSDPHMDEAIRHLARAVEHADGGPYLRRRRVMRSEIREAHDAERAAVIEAEVRREAIRQAQAAAERGPETDGEAQGTEGVDSPGGA